MYLGTYLSADAHSQHIRRKHSYLLVQLFKVKCLGFLNYIILVIQIWWKLWGGYRQRGDRTIFPTVLFLDLSNGKLIFMVKKTSSVFIVNRNNQSRETAVCVKTSFYFFAIIEITWQSKVSLITSSQLSKLCYYLQVIGCINEVNTPFGHITEVNAEVP